jgi:ferritin
MMNQIAREIYSSLLYWGISSAAEFVGYTGCKEFFEKRYHEERSHAEKFFAYLNDKQFCVQIPAIDAVVVQARTIQEFFQMSLDHEKKVTAFLNRLYEMAFSSRDNATAIFMEWFVREQVEEEAMMKNILDRINLAQGNTAALLQIDAELKS